MEPALCDLSVLPEFQPVILHGKNICCFKINKYVLHFDNAHGIGVIIMRYEGNRSTGGVTPSQFD